MLDVDKFAWGYSISEQTDEGGRQCSRKIMVVHPQSPYNTFAGTQSKNLC